MHTKLCATAINTKSACPIIYLNLPALSVAGISPPFAAKDRTLKMGIMQYTSNPNNPNVRPPAKRMQNPQEPHAPKNAKSHNAARKECYFTSPDSKRKELRKAHSQDLAREYRDRVLAQLCFAVLEPEA